MESRGWLLIGSFFGAGLVPRAPGTVGSLASLVIWAPLCLLDVAWWIRLLVAGALFVLGVIASDRLVVTRGEDPQVVVMDEVVGMGLALLFAHTVSALVVGFALFRLFDIWKPWPVRLADRRLKGGFGVMFDDVLAGLYALLGLVLWERIAWPWLSATMS